MSQPPAGMTSRSASATAPVAPQVEEETETETRSELGRPWSVIVLDDPINLMSYVVYVFQKLLGFTREKATQKMLEVHHQGRSIVANTDREQAEYYVLRLHTYGLQATLERTPD